MAETNNLNEAAITFIYTEIGRGHPSYLDGIIDQFEKQSPDTAYYKTDVFAVSKGLSLLAWHLVKYLYRIGAKGGIITWLYGILRRNSGSSGILLFLLGRDIKKFFADYNKPVIVAHPILAAILSKQNTVTYQHGELAVPDEAVVTDCYKILVPITETALPFEKAGINKNNLTITGQCIETDLVALAKTAYTNKINRINGSQQLTAALFSSGAYPPHHITTILLAGQSLFTHGYSIILFTGKSKQIYRKTSEFYKRAGIATSRTIDDTNSIKIILSSSRQEENKLVRSIFEKLDLFIAPAHERTNWAVGLGLPMFILCPHIGSYAPMNAAIALEKGVAQEITDNTTAIGLPRIIGEMRKNGKLLEMVKYGYGQSDIDGFATAAGIVSGMTGESGE